MDIDKIYLGGNLNRDPVLREVEGGPAMGLPVTSLALAVSYKHSSANGAARDGTLYVDVEVFGSLATFAVEVLQKGDAVLIEGRHRMQHWIEKQSGQQRSKLTIIAEKLHPGKKASAGKEVEA